MDISEMTLEYFLKTCSYLKRNLFLKIKLEGNPNNQKLKAIDWKTYHKGNPFKNSGLSLLKWSPIAENLKVLDKEIVLNSIKLKWNLIENEFKDLTKNLSFN